jgi:putative transposase
MNTSRTCPCCGHVSKDNRKTQINFICVECGFAANADYIAAINILGRGLKMLKGQDTADASAGCESTARIACEVNGEVRPSAAGTHRNAA